MKQLIRLTILFCACAALALTVVAGPEPLPSGKEMKEVAPAPLPECNWSGFYLGVNVGGQWGHSENEDLDYNFGVPNGFDGPKPWGYNESGVVAGGQIGYNFQWNWIVLGIEGDFGYMNVDGSGVEPGSPGNDTRGETDSDFYTTIRGRLGVAFGHWLFYGTGGWIGVNYDTRVVDNCDTGLCGGDLIPAGPAAPVSNICSPAIGLFAANICDMSLTNKASIPLMNSAADRFISKARALRATLFAAV